MGWKSHLGVKKRKTFPISLSLSYMFATDINILFVLLKPPRRDSSFFSTRSFTRNFFDFAFSKEGFSGNWLRREENNSKLFTSFLVGKVDFYLCLFCHHRFSVISFFPCVLFFTCLMLFKRQKWLFMHRFHLWKATHTWICFEWGSEVGATIIFHLFIIIIFIRCVRGSSKRRAMIVIRSRPLAINHTQSSRRLENAHLSRGERKKTALPHTLTAILCCVEEEGSDQQTRGQGFGFGEEKSKTTEKKK